MALHCGIWVGLGLIELGFNGTFSSVRLYRALVGLGPLTRLADVLG